MKKRLADLRMGEVFTTGITRREGTVLEWGHTRAFRSCRGSRAKLRAIRVSFGEEEVLLSPECLVDVEPDRPNWAADCRPAGRWARYL